MSQITQNISLQNSYYGLEEAHSFLQAQPRPQPVRFEKLESQQMSAPLLDSSFDAELLKTTCGLQTSCSNSEFGESTLTDCPESILFEYSKTSRDNSKFCLSGYDPEPQTSRDNSELDSFHLVFNQIDDNQPNVASSTNLSPGIVIQETESVTKKRGSQWTQDEHKLFLIGVQMHGRGDWKSISRNFVKTRSSIQVASHAQKYYNRYGSAKKRKRMSIHDITDVDSVSVHDLIQKGLLSPEDAMKFLRLKDRFETRDVQQYSVQGTSNDILLQQCPTDEVADDFNIFDVPELPENWHDIVFFPTDSQHDIAM